MCRLFLCAHLLYQGADGLPTARCLAACRLPCLLLFQPSLLRAAARPAAAQLAMRVCCCNSHASAAPLAVERGPLEPHGLLAVAAKPRLSSRGRWLLFDPDAGAPTAAATQPGPQAGHQHAAWQQGQANPPEHSHTHRGGP